MGETETSTDKDGETSRRKVQRVGEPAIEALSEDESEGGVGEPVMRGNSRGEGSLVVPGSSRDDEGQGVDFVTQGEGGGGREGGREDEVRGEEGFQAGD